MEKDYVLEMRGSLWNYAQVVLTNQFHFASKAELPSELLIANFAHKYQWVHNASMESLYEQNRNNHQINI